MSKAQTRIHIGDCREAKRQEKLGFVPRRTEDRLAATCRVCCPWLREKDKEDRRRKENDERVAIAKAMRFVGIEYQPFPNRVVLVVEHSGTTWYFRDANDAIDAAAQIAESGDFVVSEIVMAVASAFASLAPILEKEEHERLVSQ